MGMDSVELIWKIENRFAIRIPDAEAEKITTVQHLYDVVLKYCSTEFGDVESIKHSINEIIIDQIGVQPEDISPHKSFTSDLGMD